MQIRNSKPGAGNKFFIRKANGGYSLCIEGSPTDSQCNVLSNCVGYACGRFNEIIESMKYPYLNCNAENFIERAISAGLQIVSKPSLGGIMVWQKGATLSDSDGAGHVAIVERIDSENQIYTSESGYGGSAFWNSIRNNNNGKWGAGATYSYRGCIVNHAIGYKPYEKPVEPTPTPLKFNVGDKVHINGQLFGNADGGKPGKSVSKDTIITRAIAGKAYPYNTTGDLGWMSESSISLIENKPTTGFAVNDVVVPTNLVSYSGSKLAQYDKTYVITELYGDRAVLCAVRNGKKYVWAAMNTANIKKV